MLCCCGCGSLLQRCQLRGMLCGCGCSVLLQRCQLSSLLCCCGCSALRECSQGPLSYLLECSQLGARLLVHYMLQLLKAQVDVHLGRRDGRICVLLLLLRGGGRAGVQLLQPCDKVQRAGLELS